MTIFLMTIIIISALGAVALRARAREGAVAVQLCAAARRGAVCARHLPTTGVAANLARTPFYR
jgi:hypothetical protein